MAMHRPLVLINNIAQELPNGDNIPPDAVPISSLVGNKLTYATDGLYLGNKISETNTIYVSNEGQDSNDGLSANAPKASLDNALDAIVASAHLLMGTLEFTVLLREGDEFTVTKIYNFPFKLNIGFYDPVEGGDYTSDVGDTKAYLVQRESHPVVTFMPVEGTTPVNLAGFEGGEINLYGVEITFPLQSYGIDDYGITGVFRKDVKVGLFGCKVNLEDQYGLINVLPNYKCRLRAYGSQITVRGQRVDSNTSPYYNLRNRFIRFYLAPATNNDDVYYLNPSSLTSSNGSGLLELDWIDSEPLSVQPGIVSCESYPKQQASALGLRNYISGIIRSSTIPLNVITGREL